MNSKYWLLIFFLLFNPAYGASLWWTEKMVNLRFDVDDISHQNLVELIPAINNKVLLFDVRRIEEYQMSHIKGSIHISPKMTTQEFIDQYGQYIEDKQLIFYCSVGYRSSQFIERIQDQANKKGVKTLYNLKGGIFRWYNESHQVINDQGNTNNIHPSDKKWADLINQR
jgi:rhodanese-related sulfurtransferase